MFSQLQKSIWSTHRHWRQNFNWQTLGWWTMSMGPYLFVLNFGVITAISRICGDDRSQREESPPPPPPPVENLPPSLYQKMTQHVFYLLISCCKEATFLEIVATLYTSTLFPPIQYLSRCRKGRYCLRQGRVGHCTGKQASGSILGLVQLYIFCPRLQLRLWDLCVYSCGWI